MYQTENGSSESKTELVFNSINISVNCFSPSVHIYALWSLILREV